MGFNVVIERLRDPSPAGLERTAQALAARYGFPVAAVLERLRGGRFAAWENVDQPTARKCAAELETFGVVCSISEPAAAPGLGAVAPSYASGLSAAFSGSGAAQELGALGGGDWQIAGIDGSVDHPVDDRPTVVGPAPTSGQVSFSPPSRPAPAAAAPPRVPPRDPFAPPSAASAVPPAVPRAAPPAPPPPAGVDRFAPPDAGAEALLELDAPPPVAPASAPVAAAATAGAAVKRPLKPSFSVPVTEPPPPAPFGARLLVGLARGRANFAAGVLLAVLLGFVPASLVATVRERSYGDLVAELQRTYGEVRDLSSWDAAAAARDATVATIEQRRTNIAISSLAVWALCAAGLAFVWFRVIDWDGVGLRSVPLRRPPRPA